MCTIQILFAQSSIESVDTSIVSLDTIGSVQEQQDSSSFQYISNNIPPYDGVADSVVSVIIVNNNDFVGWIDRMDLLFSQKKDYAEMVFLPKFQRPSWTLLVILVLFISIGLVRIFFFINFQNIILGFYNDRVLVQINKEDNIITSWPYVFLFIIFTLSLGLFITLYQSYVLQYGKVEFIDFIQISIGIALLFLLKIFFIRFISILFGLGKLVREYIVFLYLFYFNSMLILLPLLLLVTFMPLIYFNYILIFFLLLVCFLFIYKFLRTMLGQIAGLRFSMFYLILYLCTLEIAPILILVKTLNN